MEREWRATFQAFWAQLLSTPTHLDSLLAKASPEARGALAELIPAFLRAPCAWAKVFGVALRPGEPWSLTPDQLIVWPRFLELVDRAGSTPPRVVASGADHPPMMYDAWLQDFGVAEADRLARVLGETPPTSLRVTRKSDRAEMAAAVRDALGVEVLLSSLSPLGLRLAEPRPAGGLVRTSNGLEIQDEGSQLLALFALDPERYASAFRPAPHPSTFDFDLPPLPSPKKSAPTIIDACAGAGGKTLAMADVLGNRGRFFAYDVSARKLEELRRRAKRAGLTSVKTATIELGHEVEFAEKFKASADLVLVDAPCSGWGVLRRNPDAKWRIDVEALARLEAIQARLLDAYARLVRPGGRLVYTLCTFRRGETTAQVDQFLQNHPHFQRGPGGFLGPGTSDGFFAQSMTCS